VESNGDQEILYKTFLNVSFFESLLVCYRYSTSFKNSVFRLKFRVAV
jgi:hypothetical protein